MCDFKLKQSFKKKSTLLAFLIVCSLFICENALVVAWDGDCCIVKYRGHRSSNKDLPNSVNINFKFFEYELPYGLDNTFLEVFDVYYSTDSGLTYTPLMSASTENQTSKSWAWIDLRNKSDDIKINLSFTVFNKSKPHTISWENSTMPRFPVRNARTRYNNETWLWMDWYLMGNQNDVTHIRVKAVWHTPGMMKNEIFDLVYDLKPKKPRKPKKPKPNSSSLNFSYSSPKQEIKTEDKNSKVNVYKEANAIVVNGALSEKIQVYTTSGMLVKSMVSDCNVIQIPLPENQLYIVYIGLMSYKITL